MAQSQTASILLVEDDKFIARAYKDGLERAGFEVYVVTSGLEAIDKTREHNPDLMLLDLILPGKNGFEILEELRMTDEFRTLPVVVLSNLGQDTDIQKAKNLGALDYLVKTDYSMKEVIERLKAHLAGLKVQMGTKRKQQKPTVSETR
jgi:DNA-binding response OmpR family regulator